MSNPSQSVPSVKRHGAVYNKRVKRMVNLLSTGEGKVSRTERANQAHFWLDAQTFDDRRQRSPAERLNDRQADAVPKDSIKV